MKSINCCRPRPLTFLLFLPSSSREGTFWGDLNHIETRFVYHQLLPRHLLQDAQAHPDALAVEDLARLASMARHAARLYARERSSLPLRLAAGRSSPLPPFPPSLSQNSTPCLSFSSGFLSSDSFSPPSFSLPQASTMGFVTSRPSVAGRGPG